MSKKLTTLTWLTVFVSAAVLVTQAVAQDPRQPPAIGHSQSAEKLEDRVELLERQLAQVRKDHASQAEEIEELESETTKLTQRVEQLDRNDVAQIKRDVAKLDRSVKDLDTRLRRIE